LLIDTNIAIHLRDGDEQAIAWLLRQAVPPVISVVTQVELEGGVVAKPQLTAVRRVALDAMMQTIAVYPFGPLELAAYRLIVERIGYSRPRILDRMIAATALVHRLTVATANRDDFRDVPGLSLEAWPGG
jgi:predicted nucleic acid-binding protein